MKYLLSTILLLFVTGLFAQSNFVAGSITKMNGETISGQIDYREWVNTPQKIRFRPSPDVEATKYGVNDLLSFKINYKNELYQRVVADINNEPVDIKNLLEYYSEEEMNRPLVLERDTVFLLVLAQGRLNLFALIDESNKTHYFIQKDSEAVAELIFRKALLMLPARGGLGVGRPEIKYWNTFRKQLRFLTQECPSLQSNIQHLTYSYNILDVVKRYNQCQGQSTYFKPKDRSEHYIYAFAGGACTSIQFKDYYNWQPKSLSPGFHPAFGLGVNLGIARTNDRLSVGLEAAYIRTKLSFLTLHDQYDGTFEKLNYTIDVPALRFNALAKFIIRTGKIAPYAQAGVSISSMFNTHYERIRTDGVYAPKTVERDLIKSNINGIGILGLHMKRFFIEGRYEFGTDLNPEADETLLMNHWSMVLGYALCIHKRSHR